MMKKEPRTTEEIEAFALDLQNRYLQNYPYVMVAETYYDEFGVDVDEDTGYKIHDLIMSGEL